VNLGILYYTSLVIWKKGTVIATLYFDSQQLLIIMAWFPADSLIEDVV